SGPMSSATLSPSPTESAPIAADDLTAVPIDVPGWSWSGADTGVCASGRIPLVHAGQASGSSVEVQAVVAANLDDDPALEAAALLRCGYGAPQVVALERGPGGAIVTLGQVVVSTLAMPAIVSIAPRSQGGVTAVVGDRTAEADPQTQSRSYAWDGQA